MNSSADPIQPGDATDKTQAPDDADTGLPGLRTRRAVYWFVLAVFALWVALLTTLSRVFS